MNDDVERFLMEPDLDLEHAVDDVLWGHYKLTRHLVEEGIIHFTGHQYSLTHKGRNLRDDLRMKEKGI